MNQKPFWRGLLRTVLTLALSLFLLSLLVFVIAHYAPGDPLRAYFGDRVEKMSVDERAWAEAKLGLDRPVLTQYGIWLQNALHDRHFSSPREVFLMTLDERGTILCIPKEDTP